MLGHSSSRDCRGRQGVPTSHSAAYGEQAQRRQTPQELDENANGLARQHSSAPHSPERGIPSAPFGPGHATVCTGQQAPPEGEDDWLAVWGGLLVGPCDQHIGGWPMATAPAQSVALDADDIRSPVSTSAFSIAPGSRDPSSFTGSAWSARPRARRCATTARPSMWIAGAPTRVLLKRSPTRTTRALPRPARMRPRGRLAGLRQ